MKLQLITILLLNLLQQQTEKSDDERLMEDQLDVNPNAFKADDPLPAICFSRKGLTFGKRFHNCGLGIDQVPAEVIPKPLATKTATHIMATLLAIISDQFSVSKSFTLLGLLILSTVHILILAAIRNIIMAGLEECSN